MKNAKYDYDVAVIGGGPAGIMSALQAVGPEQGRRVVLLEKNAKMGKKLLLTGNGRCNLTNAEFDLKKLAKNYNNGEFLFHAFSIFGPKQTIEFFNNLGVKTKIEAGNKVFPESNDANEVLEALKSELSKNNVEILYNSEVVDIETSRDRAPVIILKSGHRVSAKNFILATGGKSYPQTGSNGAGYKLAEKLGHKIVTPSPALSPIKLSAQGGPASGWKNLQGMSLKNVKITSGKFSEFGDIIFTHFGISGPAVINLSSNVLENDKIFLDLFPEMNQEEILKGLEEILRKYPRQTIKNILAEFAPEKFAEVLLEILKIDKTKIANNMSKIEKEKTVKILKNFEMTVEEVLGFDLAMVTRGGVSLKEIDHKTMRSKIVENLFFAGEIIDVDGKTGGFNLQACWSTGFTAGQNCK